MRSNDEMAGVDEPGLPTLYEWAGGLDPLRRMIDCFYDRVEADESLSGFFPGGVSEHHRAHVADWWAEVLGGPTTYTDRHGLKELVRELLGQELSKAQQTSDWGAPELSDAQKDYAASDVRYLHRLREELDRRLVREGRAALAQACFDFLPVRATLDLMGWGDDNDIFHH